MYDLAREVVETGSGSPDCEDDSRVQDHRVRKGSGRRKPFAATGPASRDRNVSTRIRREITTRELYRHTETVNFDYALDPGAPGRFL